MKEFEDTIYNTRASVQNLIRTEEFFQEIYFYWSRDQNLQRK